MLRRTLYRTVNQKSATQLKGLYRFQLQETRKFALVYGNLSKKFLQQVAKKTLFSKGVEVFLDLLEKRLDVVVFRAGFCFSIFQSRHLINHKFICVNGNLLTIPSYPCRPGDIISCKPFPRLRRNTVAGDSRRSRFVKKNHENFYSGHTRLIEYSFAEIAAGRRNTLPLGFPAAPSHKKPLTFDRDHNTGRGKREIYSTRSKLYSQSTGDIDILKRPRPASGFAGPYGRSLLLPLANQNLCRATRGEQACPGVAGAKCAILPTKRLVLGDRRPRVSLPRAPFQVVAYSHRSWELTTFEKLKVMGRPRYVNSLGRGHPTPARLAPRSGALRSGVIKPLQLEINYRCLTAVYLYPTQRIIWPTFLDLDLVIRELTR